MARSIGDTSEHSKVSKSDVRENGRSARSLGNEPPMQDNAPNFDEYYDETEPDGSAVLGRADRSGKKKKWPIVVASVAVIAALCGGGWYMYSSGIIAPASEKKEDQIVEKYVDDGKVFGGVNALGLSLGGMSKNDAYAWLLNESSNKVNGIQMQFTVNNTPYTISGEQLGAHIEVEPVLEEAVGYGREGNFEERRQAIKKAEAEGAEIPVDMVFDEQKIKQTIDEIALPLNTAPVNATIDIIPQNSEENMTIGYDKKVTEGKNGLMVDADKLAADIFAAAEAGDFTTPIAAQTEEVAPLITTENIEQQYAMRGVYSTDFTSSSNRNYNIWKMSGIINGVKIEPGDTWSINDEAGPRTSATGWKDAPGIRDGAYVDEPGGGICQVSSTLYGAVIRAEVKIADRSHHSWPLSYVPGGLDATISTGAPDFKITNTFDVPIYIVVDCDVSDRTLKVGIMAPPHEDGLTRDFSSELTGTTSGGGVVEIPDESIPAGQRVTEKGGREGKTYRVDKIWKDADGNEVKRENGWSVETYRPFGSVVRVGTGAAPVPVPDPAPVPDPVPPAPDPVPPVPDPVPPAPDPVPPAPETDVPVV